MRPLGQLLVYIINAYILLLIIRVIISWLNLPPTKWVEIINKFTDPVLDLAKRSFAFLKIGVLDLSIVAPFIILALLKKVISDIMILGVPPSPLYLIVILLSMIDSVLMFLFFIFFVITLVLVFMNPSMTLSSNPVLNSFMTMIFPLTDFLKRTVKINRPDSERSYLILTAALILIAGLLTHFIFGWVIGAVSAAQANIYNNRSLEL